MYEKYNKYCSTIKQNIKTKRENTTDRSHSFRSCKHSPFLVACLFTTAKKDGAYATENVCLTLKNRTSYMAFFGIMRLVLNFSLILNRRKVNKRTDAYVLTRLRSLEN
jgi:hypothetical protein